MSDESRAWTGDDDREFGPEPDADDCPVCRASADADCAADCDCPSCLALIKALVAAYRVAG